jgi:hypothetical protein
MNHDEVQSILARAQQIDAVEFARPEESPNYALLLEAAEEAGIRPEAVQRALSERLVFVPQNYMPDDYVFAISADGDYHVAKILEQNGGHFTVRFMNEAVATVVASALRPFQLVPGTILDCDWPKRGWLPCSVKGFLPEKEWIYVTSPEGETKYFGLDEVRIFTGERPVAKPDPLWRLKLMWLGIGGLLGAIVTWVLMR